MRFRVSQIAVDYQNLNASLGKGNSEIYAGSGFTLIRVCACKSYKLAALFGRTRNGKDNVCSGGLIGLLDNKRSIMVYYSLLI